MTDTVVQADLVAVGVPPPETAGAIPNNPQVVMHIVLASGSSTRAALLSAAGVPVRVEAPRLDEAALRAALAAEGASPRDMADVLAEAKASKVSVRHPGTPTLGCDQTLDHDGGVLAKAATVAEAAAQLRRLAGGSHRLHSAAVVCIDGAPVWRHVDTATLHMRPLSAAYIDDYLQRNWDSVRHSVGAYRIEEEGARLFTRIDGSHHAVLGLPLLPLLSWLIARGTLPS